MAPPKSIPEPSPCSSIYAVCKMFADWLGERKSDNLVIRRSSTQKIKMSEGELLKEVREHGKRMQLYRDTTGWSIVKIGKEDEKIYSIKIDENLGREIYNIYENEEKVPVEKWVVLFGFYPSKRNGAIRAFVNNFKKGCTSKAIKSTWQASVAYILGILAKRIAEDYPEWSLYQKRKTFFMIWRFRKDSLVACLPRDIMRLMLLYLNES